MFKKLLLIILAIFLFAIPVAAQNVGDAMPSLEKEKGMEAYQDTKVIASNLKTKNGKTYFQEIHRKWGGETYQVLYVVCNGIKHPCPVAIFDTTKGILYLDNEPNDGIIDKVDPNPQGKMSDVIPTCK